MILFNVIINIKEKKEKFLRSIVKHLVYSFNSTIYILVSYREQNTHRNMKKKP